MAGYILKIVIEDTHPPVWRRIVIPEKITFAKLHEMIQILFGWENAHLHDFRIPSKNICIDDGQESWDRYHYREEETPVDFFLKENKWIRYTYDFGDEWRHKIFYEKTDETYTERYAALLKSKGDNFLEDTGGVWGYDEEYECRSEFDRADAEERLRKLVCPVCSQAAECEDADDEEYLKKLLDQFVEKMTQSMKKGRNKSSAMDTASQMKKKIQAWNEFNDSWEEQTKAVKKQKKSDYQQLTLPFVSETDLIEKRGSVWTISDLKLQSKGNRELLQDLSYKEAKDYCKYLQIPVADTETRDRMTDAIADTFREHPEYLLYVFEKDEYDDFLEETKLSGEEQKEEPLSADAWVKAFSLGLADVSVRHSKAGARAEISLAADWKEILKPLTAKEQKTVYGKLRAFRDHLKPLILFYGGMSIDDLYKVYCKVYHASIDQTEFNRYLYWHGRFTNLIQTAETKEGVCYAASKALDLERTLSKLEMYAGDLEYAVYPLKYLKKVTEDISERSDWLDILATTFHYVIGLSESDTAELLERVFSSVMSGDTLEQILGIIYTMFEILGIHTDLNARCELWTGISGLMLEIEIPMLKGRSRNTYAKEKKASPWRVGMREDSGEQLPDTRTKPMCEFPVTIQEMMYQAGSYADHDAMKHLMEYREKEQIKSEEFLFLLAEAQIMGCEFQQAEIVSWELEKGSKQAKKAAGSLRMHMEQGQDAMDDDLWEGLDLWDSMQPPHKQETYVREGRKIGRNEPCPCGPAKSINIVVGSREGGRDLIYITGDTHGQFDRIVEFCERMKTGRDDIMIILGDAGINFSGYVRDSVKKKLLESLPITLFCIHGNHEQRPSTIDSYKEKNWHGGTIYCEEEYPHLLFAKDGEVFDLDGKQTIVMGGAYSIDKMIRLIYGYGWWPDEQPSEEIKRYVEAQLDKLGWKADVVLSHTTPLKYEPVEMFLSGVDQGDVDKSTEEWLDGIEDRLEYQKWYCGHYHTEKKVDRVRIMFQDVEEFGI